jgi:DNA-binding GntR family transcriptional regulator
LDEIKKRVDIMVSLNKVAEPDTKAIMEADFDFHESIVNASGNQRAIQFWNCLKSQMKMLLYAALENINTPLKFQSAESHRAIVDALEAGNCQEAAALIKTHIVLTSLTSVSSHKTIAASEEDNN